MKKLLLSLASVALMMSACTQDVAESEGNFAPADGKVSVAATFSSETRTAMTENSASGLDITWVAGDAIGLFGQDATATVGDNVEYTAVAAGKYSDFAYAGSSNAIAWGEGDHTFYAYYPYTAEGSDFAAIPASIPAVQTQSVAGNLDHLQPYSFLYAVCESTQSADGGKINFQFQNVFSVLELDVCAESGSVDCEALIFRAVDEDEIVSAEGIKVNLADGSLDYSAATTSNEIKVVLGEGATLTSDAAQKFYLMITPGHAGEQFQAIAVVGGEEVVLGAMCVPESGIPVGSKAVLSLNVPAPEQEESVIDLSANGSANCYVVNTAGAKYKFKANVKGNGYDPLAGTTAEAIDLNGANAYILWGYKKTTSDGADNTKLNASILRESVKIEGDYITFETPADMLDGNVGIAIADAEGKIMWSWHMWCIQGYDYQASAVDVAVHGMNFKIMDRNMGAFSNPAAIENPTEEDFAYAIGLLYQWGRKDPFLCGGTQYSTKGGTWFDFIKNGELVKSPTFSIKGDAAYNYNDFIAAHGLSDFAEILPLSIQSPLQFFVSSNHWVSASDNDNSNGQTTDWGKIWGNQKAEFGGTKTMYDPCPVGYTVASPDHMKFITSTAADISTSWPTWQLNATVDLVKDADTPIKNAPWGLFFYTKGVRTESAHPEDKTVVFLPKHRWVDNFGQVQDDNSICFYSNAPSPNATRGGKPYKTRVDYKGKVTFKTESWTSASQAASALAVRCVSEN